MCRDDEDDDDDDDVSAHICKAFGSIWSFAYKRRKTTSQEREGKIIGEMR